MIFPEKTKFSAGLTNAVICSLLLIAGCGQTAKVTLKFTPQDSTTYKVITQKQRSIKFEGAIANKPDLKGGDNTNRIEMTFTQRIQSIDDKGNATAKITIKELKYLAVVKDNTVLDFDSSREKDKSNPLYGLIGQSYTIKIAPNGKLVQILDTKQAAAAVSGTTPNHTAASKVLLADAIKNRHGTLALPDADKKQLQAGNSWSSIKSFSFGLMGSKSYERIYTLKEIKDAQGRQIGIVEMSTIPTAETAEQLHKQQQAVSLLDMFDNIETYTGELKLDLTTGKVEKYSEELRSEWIAVDPSAGQQDDKKLDMLTMTATRFYSLEKID